MNVIENKEGKFKLSDNGLFLLKQPNPNDICIKTSNIETIKKQNPKFFDYLLKQRQSSRLNNNSIYNDYTKFTVKKEFEIKGEKNDCLLFAERVSLNNPDYKKDMSVFSVSLGKKTKKFGFSDKNNSEIVRNTRIHSIKKNPLHNVEVNPNIGDAYSMVPYDVPINKGVCPYHASTVIFKDGTTNITIEADAGIKTNKPIFDMYSTVKHKYSFFASHMKTYLQHKFDENSKLKFKLPTVLHLKQDYKELSKSTKIKEIKPESIRRSSRLNKDVLTIEKIITEKTSKKSQKTQRKKKSKRRSRKHRKKHTRKWWKGR
tara:strand:- start:6621 stop:7568 length:948 start_codon:yes stop_codon:yes gene_type:complete